MRKGLQRILSILCAMAMLLGCTAALAEAADTVYVISAQWNDEDNYDGLRPESVTASVGGQSVTLSDENNWIAEATAPAGSEWNVSAPDGYAASVSGKESATVTFSHLVRRVDQSATVVWADDNNAAGLRPESVTLHLLANGEIYSAATVDARNGWTAKWTGIPVTEEGNPEYTVVYSIEQSGTPDGYQTSVSGATVTNTLLTGKLSLSAEVVGVPEGADVSALSLTVTGPDPRMPVTLTYGQVAGGYDLGDVIPGAYLVRTNNADSLVEGYTMDPTASKVADAVVLSAGGSAALNFRYTYREPVEEEPNETPEDAEGNLVIEILGPDYQKTITYAEFVDGKYELDDLAPGSYVVVERNAETLINAYTLTSESVTGMTVTVEKNGTATAKLFNQYAPSPLPEPEPELIDIPVTKTWVDNNNKDGNRPAAVEVTLYANGAPVATQNLSEGTGWAATFMQLPTLDEEGNEIAYTVNETPVEWYTTSVNGYNITNTYTPETTSVTVSKVWDDNGNAHKFRPTSLAVTLHPTGEVFILNEANNWTVTVDQLATRINGEPVTYSWTEQEAVGYTAGAPVINGNATMFTNHMVDLPKIPDGFKPPKMPLNDWIIINDYENALGLEVTINHVGDCFD